MSPTLDPGAVISRAVAVYRDNFAILFWSAALVLVIPFVLAAILDNTAGSGIASLLTVILGSFYVGMVVELVGDVQDGRRDNTMGQLFAGVVPVLGTLLVVSFLAWIGIGIGLLFIILPGLFLMTIWAVVAPVVVLERSSVLGAFRRSQELVRGNGTSTFAVVLTAVVGIEIIRTLVEALTSNLGAGAGAVITWAVAAATEPISAVAVAVLYYALVERER